VGRGLISVTVTIPVEPNVPNPIDAGCGRGL
jgi:hypothetical protein